MRPFSRSCETGTSRVPVITLCPGHAMAGVAWREPVRWLSGRLRGAVVGCALLLTTPAVLAQAFVLGEVTPFGVLGASAVNSTGPTLVTGDLGISPNTASSVTGFDFSAPPGAGQVVGQTHFADATATAAQVDATTVYNTLAGQPCSVTIGADLGGTTLVPGVYCSNSSMGLTGTVTLDAQGDPDATFVFQVGSAFTSASNARVNIINGGQGCNVFWQVGSSATLGTGTQFVGNLIALASVTLNTGARVDGHVIARTAAVTMDSASVTVCTLAPAPQLPALAKAFAPATIDAGGTSVLTVTLSNPGATVATLTSALLDTLPAGVVVAALPDASTTCGSASVSATAGGSSVSLAGGSTIPAGGSCQFSVRVTAAAGGSYLNTLGVGALRTSVGDNPTPALATLTVIAPGPGVPALGKSFAPASVMAGGLSRLVIVLSNPDPAAAVLLAPLTDTLPSGVVVAAVPDAQTTCTGAGAVVAVAGGDTVSLAAGRVIPAAGSCTLSVWVSAASAGAYTNTIPAGGLLTGNGANPDPAIATLTVVSVIPPIQPPTLTPPQHIPATSPGALVMLFGLVALGMWLGAGRRPDI